MEFLCRNANFCTKPELGAIGEGGWCVVINTGCIYLGEELVSRGAVFGDDALGVPRTETTDVTDGLVG